MSNKAVLLVIDPQVDFCDPKGNLYVNGADKDMVRLADMVNKYSDLSTSPSIPIRLCTLRIRCGGSIPRATIRILSRSSPKTTWSMAHGVQ
jgi:hypothetical protein